MSIGAIEILVLLAAVAVVALLVWGIVTLVNKSKGNPDPQRPDSNVRD